MAIDAVYLLVLIFAIFQGLSKGFILGIFSFFALLIGLVAALKLSAVVANYLHTATGGMNKWLPVLSFILVFVLFILLVSFVGKFIKKAVGLAMLGWLDSLLGMILYMAIYTFIFSIFLFFGQKIHFISPETIAASRLYPYISTWGTALVDNLGKLIPFFKNIFVDLSNFFAQFAKA